MGNRKTEDKEMIRLSRVGRNESRGRERLPEIQVIRYIFNSGRTCHGLTEEKL